MPNNDTSIFDAAAAQVMHQDAQSTATQIRNNVQFAVGTNADQAAEYQHLAKYVGVPPETVQAQPDVVRQQAALKSMDADKLVADQPVLAKYLTDPNNAAKSHDDITPLAAVERAAKALPGTPAPNYSGEVAIPLPDRVPTLRDRLVDWWAGFTRSIGIPGGMTAEQQRQAASDAEANAILAARARNPALRPGPDATPAQIDALNDQAWEASRQAVGGMSQVPQMAAERFIKAATFGIVSPTVPTKPHSWQASTAGAAGSLAGFIAGPAKVASAAVGAAPGASMLAPVAGEAWLTGLAKNVVQQAATIGAASGLQETGGAVLDSHSVGEAVDKVKHAATSGAATGAVFGAAGKLLPDNTVAQWLGRAVGVSAAQDAIDGTNPLDDRPLEDKLFGYGMNLLFTAHGAGRTNGGWFIDHPDVRKGFEDADKAEAAQRGGEALQALSALAAGSKTRERDPEAFKQFVRDATDDGQLHDVYVDAGKFAEVLNQSGVGMPELASVMPDVAAQMHEAAQTNGDIRIPVEDYATHIAGGKLDQLLLPHLKVDPDGFTYQQSQEYYVAQHADLKAQAEKILTAKASEDASAAEAQQIHDKVLDQLNATGRFRPEVNSAYAALTRDFYVTMADRTGMKPAELYERYPLKVAAESLDAGFNQEAVAKASGDIAALAAAANEPGNSSAKVKITPAQDWLIQAARDAGLEIEGFEHSIDTSAIRHVRKNHGNEAKEVARGQLPVTDADFTQIPHIIAAPDRVVFGTKNRLGRDQIVYLKKLPDGSTLYLEEVRNGRKELAAQAMRKYPATMNAESIVSTLDPNARSDGEASSITQFLPDLSSPDLAQGNRGGVNLPVFEDGQGAGRGSYNPDTHAISLLKHADLSTFLHESGHFYFEVLHDLARAPDAPQQVRDDLDTLLRSFGIEGDSAEQRMADWSGRTLDQKRDGHEQFARSFEAYLLEGKAPTLELQSMFSRFRSWLVSIYHSLKGLNVELSDEVRGVMDRLVATDDAIRYTEQARGYLPLHVEGTPEEIAAYQAMGREATDKATAEMDARSLRDMQWASNAKAKALRDLQKQADAQRKTIREEVTREMEAEPVRQAEAYLKRPNGTDPAPAEATREWEAKRDAEDVRLRDQVKAEYLATAEGAAAHGLKKGQFLAKNKRAIANEAERRLLAWEQENPRPGRGDPGIDIVAEMFGFESGAALRKAIKEAGKLTDRIGQETDRRMLERHGDLVDPASVERAAEAAVHNEVRARFIATGLKMLAKSPIPARQLAEAAREAAEAAVAAKRVRDLRPAQHAAAEARANKEAVKLAAKDDQAGAVQQQRAALLNNRLFRAATDAVAEIQKGVAYLGKFDRASVREKIALEYRDQIDALLDRFDLRKSTTNTALDQRQSLLTFVEQLAAQGLEPQVPEGLLNEAQRKHFKDMTVEEFRGLVDAVKSLDHLGRNVQKLVDGQEKRDIAELAAEAAQVMGTLPQRGAESNRGLTRIDAALLKLKSAGRSVQAALLKMEQMMDWLDDRNPNGVLNRIVFRRIADAGVKEANMLAKVKAEIDQLTREHLADVTRDKGKIYEAPGLIDGATGKPQRFTKKEMLALAGNMGNESNLQKLLNGEKWSETAVWQFLNENMTKADWDFVAGIGRTLESLWPEKVAMSRRLGNTNPEKIAPRPFDTPHGRYEGWYWPMIYDPARSHDVAMRGAKNADALFENVYARANTDTGRSNTRSEGYARPLLLSIDVIPRVIRDEIHDIAYREAIIDADKFLRDPTVRKSIVNALSQEHYDQLRPWLQSIANDRKVDMQALKWFDALAHGARTRATIVGLGYRLSTMLVHGSSAAMESVAEVGPVWFAKGLADFANPRNWAANQDFVFERSGEMRNRMNEVDRDVREHLREIDIRLMDPTSGALARGTDLMKAHAYQGIAMLDMASALPTWMAAYHKGMAPVEKGGKGLSEQDAIYFADKTVRNAHGGTGVKDLAAVQRGPEFFKLFTMFYTFWNHNINRLMDTARLAGDARTWRDTNQAATVIMRFLIYTLGVQTMHHMLHPQKDDEGDTHWLAWAGKEFLSAASAGVPIARDVSAHFLTGKDYSVTPAAGMVDAIGKSGVDAANALTGKETDPKVLRHSLTTAGYLFGLPLGQPASTAQFLWDVTDGKQDPQTLQDWWAGIMHGDMTKH